MTALFLALLCLFMLVGGVTAWSPSSGLGLSQNQKIRSHPTHRRLMAKQDDADDDDDDVNVETKHSGYNVLGTELSCCCSNVGGSGIGTGFYRNGYCGKCKLNGSMCPHVQHIHIHDVYNKIRFFII